MFSSSESWTKLTWSLTPSQALDTLILGSFRAPLELLVFLAVDLFEVLTPELGFFGLLELLSESSDSSSEEEEGLRRFWLVFDFWNEASESASSSRRIARRESPGCVIILGCFRMGDWRVLRRLGWEEDVDMMLDV